MTYTRNEAGEQRRLPLAFYTGPTLVVARRLLGALLVSQASGAYTAGRIMEVEAYLGADDPASHAFKGITRRNSQMWSPAGTAYVYTCYGVHYCLNVVTEEEGCPGAVLVRAIEPLDGIDLMRKRRGRDDVKELASGPGKLCKALGIDLADNGASLVTGRIFLQPGGPDDFRGGRHAEDRYITGHRPAVEICDSGERVRFPYAARQL